MIDAYTHVVSSREYLKELANCSDPAARKMGKHFIPFCEGHPNFINLEKRIEDLDKYKIDHQVTMFMNNMDPSLFPLKKKEAMSLFKRNNDDLAKMAEASRGRLRTLGGAPLTLLEDGGVEEMKRAVKDLGLAGFVVVTNVRGKPIDMFEKFWATADKLGAVVYIHPTNPVGGEDRPYEEEYDLAHVLGWPFETGLILLRLIFSGVMERHPGLKVVSHHLGGVVPFFAGRIDESYARTWTRYKEDQVRSARITKPLIEHIRGFYHDTAVGGSTAALRCGYEVYGPDRIVFSTDYPWGPDSGRGRLASYAKLVRDLKLPPEDERKIFDENIRRIIDFN